MRVTCGHCNAAYEFEASQIPAEGYDAQCTHCASIFFVSPQLASPPSEPPSPVASQQPPTHTGTFVAPQQESTPVATAHAPSTESTWNPSSSAEAAPMELMESIEPEPIDPEPIEPQPLEAEPIEPEPFVLSKQSATSKGLGLSYEAQQASIVAEFTEIAETEDAEPPSAAETTAAFMATLNRDDAKANSDRTHASGSGNLERAAFADDDDNDEFDRDFLALDDQLGEPDLAPAGSSMEEDFGALMRRRRRRQVLLGAMLIGLLGAGACTYFAFPGVWDTTVGPVLGIKARINPDAIPHVEQGLEKIWDDTEESYEAALEQFEAALALDALYPDAIVYTALVRIFRGSALRERGQQLRQQGDALLGELQSLLDAKKGKKAQEQLRKKIATINQDAAALYEHGGDDLKAAELLIRDGLKNFPDFPPMVVASGIYLISDPDRAAQAMKHLVTSQILVTENKSFSADKLADPWSAYLYGKIQAAQRNDLATITGAFEIALKLEPRFQRARYELAKVYLNAGDTPAAIKLSRALLKAVPSHVGAQKLIASTQIAKDGTHTAAPETEPQPTANRRKDRTSRQR
ncbi:MAG: zinc-ribbon domain-containing protein [Myxococcota bacterium]